MCVCDLSKVDCKRRKYFLIKNKIGCEKDLIGSIIRGIMYFRCFKIDRFMIKDKYIK